MNSQPISKVVWVDASALHANDYNPNHVAPPEMKLLKISLLESGWTQPIVARADGQIVDGFHRWTLAQTDKQVAAMTDGKVPVVYLDPKRGEQMMATVRHNRARGSHGVLPMAEIVRHLIDQEAIPAAEVARRLGMEDEEVERLYDRGGMTVRGSREGFNKGWVPDAGGEAEKVTR